MNKYVILFQVLSLGLFIVAMVMHILTYEVEKQEISKVAIVILTISFIISLWTIFAGTKMPTILNDGNTIGWYIAAADNLTLDVVDVTTWDDETTNNHDVTHATLIWIFFIISLWAIFAGTKMPTILNDGNTIGWYKIICGLLCWGCLAVIIYLVIY